ncbi:hypothetical protein C2R67_06335 [Helicobacter pylori]|uniref:hypothetical protein n=1 Tax=Helicobacter pylori TaxID=210 RepID=UPI000D372286|nr:hypothetical protein [Helicobacter pylori]PUD42284.1 hypothetical protein C2R67_06335 [Helicobacter pylori]WRG89982.1 hypothetical protein FNE17_01005 [Helicobacter pylori]
MRQKNETATSFNQLKAITQMMQAQKTRAKTSANAHAIEPTQEISLKPLACVKTKKGTLQPTKRAFSERQITTFRDHSQARANSSRETKASHNANAFKTEQANNSSLRAEPSAKALKQGLKTQESKGGQNEA